MTATAVAYHRIVIVKHTRIGASRQAAAARVVSQTRAVPQRAQTTRTS